MPLPSAFGRVTVHGKYTDLLGVPVSGRVTFTPTPIALTDSTDLTTIMAVSISVDLVAGEFSVDLPATDDPDISPAHWTYRVDEKFTGGIKGRSFSIEVPVALAGVGLDITTLAPVDPASGVGRPTRLVQLGDVDLSAAAPGSILQRQPDGSWRAVTLPFVTTAQLADVVRLGALAGMPEVMAVGAIDYDGSGARTGFDVVWPDGTPGRYNATVLSVAHPGAVDAYEVTYGSPVVRTYVQPTMTRNADGAVTYKPAIEVT